MSNEPTEAEKNAARKLMERYHLSMYQMDIEENARIIHNELAAHRAESESELAKALSEARETLIWFMAVRDGVDYWVLAQRFKEFPLSRPLSIKRVDAALTRYAAAKED